LAPSAGASDSPSASPSPSVAPSHSPSPTPGVTPGPRTTPTATASPTPTVKPVPPSFGLALTECPGGVVLNWSKYGGAGFARYVTLRATNPNIPKTYPPQAGVITMAGTTVRTKTSGADGSVADGKTYFYRTLALGPADKVLAASAVESGLGFGQKDLGPLS